MRFWPLSLVWRYAKKPAGPAWDSRMAWEAVQQVLADYAEEDA